MSKEASKSTLARKRVAILFGGRSVEHEVSLLSARNVYEAIDRSRYDVVLIGIDKTGLWRVCDTRMLEGTASPSALPAVEEAEALALVPGKPQQALIDANTHAGLPPFDVVFPVLHGSFGEDGTVQGLLRLANVPFVGAGVLGSAVAMDKDVTKRLLRDAGLPIPRFAALERAAAARTTFAELEKQFGAPFFAKPANTGSSVGISKVRTAADWPTARAEALRYDHKLLVEEAVTGREIEVAVLGNDEPEASVPGEIVPHHEFYSYEAKYLDENGAELVIPAPLDPTTARRAQSLALEVFRALGCAGMARVDFFLRANGELLVNEINTIPGFTRMSMYPKLWAASGVPYGALIERLLALAIERFAADQRLATSFDLPVRERHP